MLFCTYFDPSALNTVASPPTSTEPMPEFALLAFQAICVAPIVEEVVFRGVLMQSWAVRWGLKRGIIFSSLVFALLHFSPEIMDKFIGGIFLSILFIKYRSLIIPIFFHILNNSLVQLESLFRQSPTSADLTLYQYKTAGWVLFIMFILTFSIFIIYLKKNNLHNRVPVT